MPVEPFEVQGETSRQPPVRRTLHVALWIAFALLAVLAAQYE